MADVFISYAPSDSETVQRISSALRDQGFSVYLDSSTLVAGIDFRHEVKIALRSSRTVLIVLSANSKRGQWVEHELQNILVAKENITPVLLDDEGKNNWVWPLVSDRIAFRITDDSSINELVHRLSLPTDHVSVEDYLEGRLKDQLAWYITKSDVNKRLYYSLQSIALAAVSLVPLILLVGDDPIGRLVAVVLSVVAAITSSILSAFNFRDQWLECRSTAESLKYEKYLFLTGSDPYHSEQAFSLFVHTVESIIVRENLQWSGQNLSVIAEGN